MDSGLDGEHGSAARAVRITGLRRLTAPMLTADQLATRFEGTEASPGQILAAFKAAAASLGITPRVVHAVDWLFRFTQPQDWQPGRRPVVWPSAGLQQEALGLGPAQVKNLNRHLIELGLIAAKDSPNGKRYGRRDKAGNIVLAYGFDLSPLAARLEEFQEAAERARAEREALRDLRRRLTIARNSLRQTFETVREYRLTDVAWTNLESTAAGANRPIRLGSRAEEIAPVVEGFESLAEAARRRLEEALAEAKPVEISPMGPENQPHQNNYKPTSDRKSDTVTALNARNPAAPGAQGAPERRDGGSVLTITPDELARLAPRLRPYLPGPAPSWPEIVEAADWLRHELGVSKPLWGDACLALGREKAAIAVAIVSAKPAGHFRRSAGGYFHGMVAKARAGELNLARTIWGMRKQADGSPVGRTQPALRN